MFIDSSVNIFQTIRCTINGKNETLEQLHQVIVVKTIRKGIVFFRVMKKKKVEEYLRAYFHIKI